MIAPCLNGAPKQFCKNSRCEHVRFEAKSVISSHGGTINPVTLIPHSKVMYNLIGGMSTCIHVAHVLGSASSGLGTSILVTPAFGSMCCNALRFLSKCLSAIVNLGMLAAQRCGMPLNTIQTHAKALQFMQYTVNTVHGISSGNYSGNPFEPLFGAGEGSGASSGVWISLFVILMDTLDHFISKRMKFQSPNATITHSRLIDAFVDDISFGFTDLGPLSYTEMINRINYIAQTWERLLAAFLWWLFRSFHILIHLSNTAT